MYHTKYANENKAIDMSALPPCRSVLRFHADRANFLTAMWKRPGFQNIDAPEITSHGWLQDGRIMWVDKYLTYPSEIEDVLLDPDYDEIETYGDEGASDNEDDGV